jgi:DNA-directed RNA polymerase specialized sigma24 family protein
MKKKKAPDKISKLKKKTPAKLKKKIKVPESELLAVIEVISKKLAYKFKFGYHEYEDMKQQITVFALQGMENYDGIRPLENFLWTHVRNRLFNYKRDNYQRPNKPCLTCPLYDAHCAKSSSQCLKFNDKTECAEYSGWSKRNNTKKNLMYLNSMEQEPLENTSFKFLHHDKSMEQKEIFDLLDNSLNGEEREIYLRLKGGSKLTKIEMNKLTLKIKEILGT